MWPLRIALYVQVLLGILLFLGAGPRAALGDTHLGLGAVIVVLAAALLRPAPGAPPSRMRALARWFPLAPLAVGLGLRLGAWGGLPVVILHMLLGITAVALVEVVAARERRLRRAS
jgi:hypothetical protein